jgi:peptidoglycan/xylan/chitin deacetylase (PgdA/CDA1 family)
MPLSAELRNTMPNAYLERFKSDANGKAARFPDVYVLEGSKQEKQIYLTFDDGPDRVNTPKILDILKAEGVQATFFFLGSRIETSPSTVRRAAAEGHMILPHGQTHIDFRKLPFKRVLNKQILPVAKRIETITGKRFPKAFRPPYGAVTDAQIEAFAKAGYRIFNWSVDSFDWMKGRKSDQIVAEVMRYVHPGAIILLHSGAANRQTPGALKTLIALLKKAGYRFATLY